MCATAPPNSVVIGVAVNNYDVTIALHRISRGETSELCVSSQQVIRVG
jgi:hypothetical protein